ncbi:hypothetical protein AVEN_229737-1 [Araneus ventricosus]|uniref:Uncharacterized protein n=1 Tax=Araneus ventricosus TaxID=182803 RepID=A0A4Y2XA77_ARAVE|nr:hypothetical protein AVEN_67097-1 [Araneus ventricosus]GBO44832.1 hypothetical protein AVEN_229737-1 [Araneus ventricosus]
MLRQKNSNEKTTTKANCGELPHTEDVRMEWYRPCLPPPVPRSASVSLNWFSRAFLRSHVRSRKDQVRCAVVAYNTLGGSFEQQKSVVRLALQFLIAVSFPFWCDYMLLEVAWVDDQKT